MLRTLTAPGLAQGALYFKFYMHQALAKVGEGDRYLDQLDDWRGMLANGLTTFAEVVDRPGHPTRSDCHAWSASPNIELMRTVLGVDSAAPGFSRVVVRPHLGQAEIRGRRVPRPRGSIEVRVEAAGNVSVTLRWMAISCGAARGAICARGRTRFGYKQRFWPQMNTVKRG